MKKRQLLNLIDNELLEKLYGFCYARTADSHEGQELCSEILFALVKSSNREGELEHPYPFIWQVARNVYADFARHRRQRTEAFYQGDPEEILPLLPAPETEEDWQEPLNTVYRRIAFLTKIYRETMIWFYLDGLSTAEIAKRHKSSETAVRQRLFSARKKVRNEVDEMTETCNKPVALDTIEFYMWGRGIVDNNCNPWDTCTRQFSKHIIWLCRKKPRSASEIAMQLNVPTLYVEEELDILARGGNGDYGLLRRMDGGKYALNFILFDKDTIETAHGIYTEHLPAVCGILADFIETHREEYLAFPYLNRKIDLNLILWQQMHKIADAFIDNVERILSEQYFPNIEKSARPFSVYAHEANGKMYKNGWDGVSGSHVCGYSTVCMDNIYTAHIRPHFHCGLNLAADAPIQLALRAIDGLAVSALTREEKEPAAKAVEEGYLYREGDMLYTKILVNDVKDVERIFDITNRLSTGYFDEPSQIIAGKLSELFRKTIPEHLLGEWRFANQLSALPIMESLTDFLIEKGLLIPPADGIGAEGCWMGVAK